MKVESAYWGDCGGARLGPGAFQADNREGSNHLPTLSVRKTKHYLRAALKRRFKASYRHGYAKRIKGCSRLSRTKVRCRVSWVIGDLSYRGRETIWLRRRDGDVYWWYAYTIRRTNEYCKATGGRRCAKTVRER